ncbi:MAG TPA: DUF4397 domain-containing protein, partial [Gemmatimonadaceae bacterium]|nr:DUF4397 domain-containing protein [Gemmatimonadaceae bacterium]
GPTAGVRFINAVPDTGAAYGMDFRFVDIVENSDAFRITFRDTPTSSGAVTASSSIQFKPAAAGSRHFRVFLDDTLQNIASTVLVDSTVTLTASHNYTFLLWGNARSTGSDKMKLTMVDETVADPTPGIALRVINTTGSPIDVRQYVSGAALPASPTWASVAPYSISTYVPATPAQIKYNVQPAGGGTTMFTDVQAIIGTPVGTQTAGCTVGLDCDVTPGSTVPGTALTMIVFPPSVTGSKAAAFTTPGGSFMWDRRPPIQCTVSFGC